MVKNQASTQILVKVSLAQNVKILYMLCIAVKEFLFWKKKQLSKGGDQQSFTFLLDCIGGISTSDLNSLTINFKSLQKVIPQRY